MSEKKNHLDIEGAQAKEEEHIATYKPIPEADTEFRSSKPNLSKSREKVSDEAAEKLLKEDQVGIRVDMADAKYVVGDHRNGDAKIELDANKKQFSGLTKEELMKYADDPFWVRLRWFMFALFWALWLSMLVGAIAIIVTAPKCAAPEPKTRFQKGPLVDLSSTSNLADLEASLDLLQKSHIQAIFIPGSIAGDTYKVLEEESALDQVKGFIKKAKEYGVGVIVDLTANFVPTSHAWFVQSENRSEPYAEYFVWAEGRGRDDAGNYTAPNNWRSTLDTPAWNFNPRRQQFYLAQYGAGNPDLNFRLPEVVAHFDNVLKSWMAAGAVGVRLHKARELLTATSLQDETAFVGAGADRGSTHAQYSYYKHQYTSDQPELDALLMHWSHIVDDSGKKAGSDETVFTLSEDGSRPELMLLGRNLSCLRPPSAAPRAAAAPAALAAALAQRLKQWPALQLTSEEGVEIASLALLLPAAPVLTLDQVEADEKNASNPSESYLRLAALRGDASVEHGQYAVSAAPADNSTEEVLVVSRWKDGHTGYLGVWNPAGEGLRANLTALPLPRDLTLHAASRAARQYANYTNNKVLPSDSLLVPPRSTLVLSFVPIH